MEWYSLTTRRVSGVALLGGSTLNWLFVVDWRLRRARGRRGDLLVSKSAFVWVEQAQSTYLVATLQRHHQDGQIEEPDSEPVLPVPDSLGEPETALLYVLAHSQFLGEDEWKDLVSVYAPCGSLLFKSKQDKHHCEKWRRVAGGSENE
uniref:Uncharacterized protein n=1 Tax=Mycena chlorophos TaxID=658473 RepID=A0ABQ0L7N2_MYCCL|nr:predicted protein [Mycena chlorophos]